MRTLADRFRRWYDHERDSNAKIVAMLQSVPADKRSTPEFAKALHRATHVILARQIWLKRLGHSDAPMPGWDAPPATLEELPGRFAEIESAWSAYLAGLDDKELGRVFDFSRPTGETWRWDVEGVLTQVHGHAWYHRGQIASLVAACGGKAVDTDYVFWVKPEKLK